MTCALQIDPGVLDLSPNSAELNCMSDDQELIISLDDSTASRLSSARREALAQVSVKRSIGLSGTPWATATAGLAALLMADVNRCA